LISHDNEFCHKFTANLWQNQIFSQKSDKKQPLARSGIDATGSLGVRFESVILTFIIEKCSF